MATSKVDIMFAGMLGAMNRLGIDTMFNKKSSDKNKYMLRGINRRLGYDWWWHSFTAVNEKTGEERAFFIEYFIINPALAEDTPVLGQQYYNKKLHKRPSYLMVKAGTWGKDHIQLHRFFGLNKVSISGKPEYEIKAEDCYLSDKLLQGKIELSKDDVDKHPEYMCDAGTMSWELVASKKIAFNVGYGTSPLLRMLEAFEMYWHAEGMKTEYAGNVYLNGEKYIVTPERTYGYADKNWGRGFTTPWVWLSSNHLVSRISGKELNNSVFDIGGGRPKIYWMSIPSQLLAAMYYEGREFEFNFSKFWTFTKTKFACKEVGDEVVWRIMQQNSYALMKTEMRCKKEDMLWVNYEAPDGSKRHNRLWNGGTGYGRIQLYLIREGKKLLVDDIDVYNAGCEFGEYDPR